MGWLWSSQSPSKGPDDDTTTAQARPQAPLAPTQQPEPAYSDPEVAKFMADLQDAFGGSSKPSSSYSTTTEPFSKATSTTSTPIEQADNNTTPPPPPSTTDSPWRSLWGPAAQARRSASAATAASRAT